MAEEKGEKTETPTPRRREEARERGQVARSPDLTAAVLLLGFLLLMNSFGPPLIAALQALMTHCLSAASLSELEPGSIGPSILQGLTVAARALAPFMVGIVSLAILINLAQVGFIFTTKRLQPNLGMLNPLKGLKRMFEARNFVHLAVNVAKLVLVGLVAWSAIRARLPDVVSVQQLPFTEAFGLAAGMIFSIGLRIAAVLLVLALLDYGYQRYNNEQKLKMSKREVKDEMRHMEGDPKIKQRRRQIAIQMATRQLRKDVPTADVIVTNPTHVAVALKYDAAAMSAPRVVAKGQDLMAQRIRQIAIEHGIPIVERAPLARALHRLVPAGHEIPEQFYSAVAEILAYVYELTGKLRKQAG
jgi:flagellar biosynthesis protein FlhB